MKYLTLAFVFVSSIAGAETFSTDSFNIQIERDCEEGEVTCDSIKFVYSPLGSDQKQTVFGKTVHSMCADGTTPCAFQGYEFLADGAKYFIHNSGVLEVTDNQGKQLLLEQGEWQY